MFAHLLFSGTRFKALIVLSPVHSADSFSNLPHTSYLDGPFLTGKLYQTWKETFVSRCSNHCIQQKSIIF